MYVLARAHRAAEGISKEVSDFVGTDNYENVFINIHTCYTSIMPTCFSSLVPRLSPPPFFEESAWDRG